MSEVPTRPQSPHLDRLGSLDTMRGVAIMGVIFAHVAGPFAAPGSTLQDLCGFGVYGVQLFFLISAWTMCFTWFGSSRDIHKLVSFYIRRLLRIAPLFWLAMLVYWLANSWQPAANPQIVPYELTVVLSILLAHSLVPGAITSAVPGGWSIGVEVLFYMIFPVLATLIGRSMQRALISAAIIYGILVMLQVFIKPLMVQHWGETGTAEIDAFLYFSLLTQLPVFLVGITIFQANSPRKALIAGAAMLGLALIAIFLKQLLNAPGRPGFIVTVIICGSALWIAIHFNWKISLLSAFGRMSYSVYLVHFLIIDFIARMTDWNQTFSHFWAAVAITISISAVLGEVSRRTLELACSNLAKKALATINTRPPFAQSC